MYVFILIALTRNRPALRAAYKEISPMTYMLRKLERPINEWIQRGCAQPLLLQGARRVGKTVLAEHIGLT